jgi:hypothetical protein
MTRTPARTMDFFDRSVGALIAERFAVDGLSALRKFLRSETYRMLSDDDLKLWHMSPLAVFDMWQVEQKTGDPRQSVYIGGDDGQGT